MAVCFQEREAKTKIAALPKELDAPEWGGRELEGNHAV